MEPRPFAKHSRGNDIPLEEQIYFRAHRLYVERGNESASGIDDWLQAHLERY